MTEEFSLPVGPVLTDEPTVVPDSGRASDYMPGMLVAALVWWDEASTAARLRLVAIVGGLLAVAAVVVTATSGPSAEELENRAETAAQSAGYEYANKLHDQGYNSMSIYAQCTVNSGGYQGSHVDAYQNGCTNAWLQYMREGE